MFSERKDPYEVFEKKVLKAFYLERKIMIEKFGKEEQHQSRIHYIVYLVSCLEFFLEEIFKKALDEGVIDFDDVKKLKKISSLRFDIGDIQNIKEDKIRLSEIVSEEMRFQNSKDMSWLWKVLKTGKNFKLIASKKGVKFDFPESLKENRKSVSEKEVLKFMVKSFGRDFALPKTLDKFRRMDNTVKKMIFLRHKIVHKAHIIKIDNWESWAYTMATVQLAFFAYQSYLLEKLKLKEKS